MEQGELLLKIADALDKLSVNYAVVGSTASILYGEPRLTNDIDVVIDLEPTKVEAFCAEFPAPEFYVSRAAVESAVRKRFQFNIIHPSSGFKVDCFIAGNDPFDRNQLSRAIRIPGPSGEREIRIAAPEDVIVKKLEYFRLGQSEKHARDICGMLKMEEGRIDRDYIRLWAERKGLIDVWEAVLARLNVKEPESL